jgi:hypothetical protein
MAVAEIDGRHYHLEDKTGVHLGMTCVIQTRQCHFEDLAETLCFVMQGTGTFRDDVCDSHKTLHF